MSTATSVAVPCLASSTHDGPEVWGCGNVPELELARAQVGSAAVVRLRAFADAAMPGTIARVAPALGERTRLAPIRVTRRAPDGRLRSGLFGSIEIGGRLADERVLVVPADEMVTFDSQTVVCLPADEPNSFRPPVAPGRRAGDCFEMRSGLGERARLAISAPLEESSGVTLAGGPA